MVDVGKCDRKIGGVVPRLRIGDVHSVKENCNLVEGAAVDRNVGLHPETSTLTHIHARSQFQNVVDCLCRRPLNVLAVMTVTIFGDSSTVIGARDPVTVTPSSS